MKVNTIAMVLTLVTAGVLLVGCSDADATQAVELIRSENAGTVDGKNVTIGEYHDKFFTNLEYRTKRDGEILYIYVMAKFKTSDDQNYRDYAYEAGFTKDPGTGKLNQTVGSIYIDEQKKSYLQYAPIQMLMWSKFERDVRSGKITLGGS